MKMYLPSKLQNITFSSSVSAHTIFLNESYLGLGPKCFEAMSFHPNYTLFFFKEVFSFTSFKIVTFQIGLMVEFDYNGVGGVVLGD